MSQRMDALKENPEVRWSVKITSPEGLLCDVHQGSYAVAIASFESAAKATEDKTLKEMLDRVRPSFGVMGFSNGVERSIHTSCCIPRVPTGEKSHDGASEWERFGATGERVCSGCGSLHPEDMLARLKAKGLAAIEVSTKAYKWYLSDSAVNASLGPIKYYREHDTPELLEELKRLIEAEKESDPGGL